VIALSCGEKFVMKMTADPDSRQSVARAVGGHATGLLGAIRDDVAGFYA